MRAASALCAASPCERESHLPLLLPPFHSVALSLLLLCSVTVSGSSCAKPEKQSTAPHAAHSNPSITNRFMAAESFNLIEQALAALSIDGKLSIFKANEVSDSKIESAL